VVVTMKTPVRRAPSTDLLLDAALAAGFLGVGAYEVLVRPLAEDRVPGPVWLDLIATAAATLPLAWRRRAPLLVSLLVFAALAARALVGEPLEIYPVPIAGLVATYTVASYAPLRDALLAAAFAGLALAIAVVNGSGTDAAPAPLASAVLYGTVWLAGRMVGVRHERARALHAARDRHAAEAVAAERDRIAREMHDAVSHSLAAIVMQAAGARNVLETDPPRVRRSLEAIESTGRRGLEEMRRLLGLLGESEAERTPQVGLDRLAELVGPVQEAGLHVVTRVAGDPRPLPDSVDVSAYRILQESLTNVMEHAAARQVQVTVTYAPQHLEVEVTDDGAPAGAGRPPGGGRGLAGMRGRAELLGGELQAGPVTDGFRVRARLPL
jgi:signal transduction histidine kinase